MSSRDLQRNAPPYIQRLFRVGDFTVYEVDGNWIRTNQDPDFTNFAHYLTKRYIPEGELWVDHEHAPGELPFFVTNMLVQIRMMREGVPYGVALNKADKVEHRERQKQSPTQPLLHPYPITDLFLEDLGNYAGCAAKLIDGNRVRTDWYPDFTEGGHDLVYKALPPKTLIIDNDVAPEEREPTMLHEGTERPLMEQGMPYPLAHQFALQAEWAWRHREKTARYKLSRRITFRGLQISVETDKGEKRHWHDPHEHKDGVTLMKYPYGYIRRTEGVDGDHVDVYVGPNEDAKSVYIVHQMKAPDFKKFDEDKCMLGFDTLEDAKKAYLAHYNKPGFLGSITTMPFEEFKEKVMKTYDHPKKLAEVVSLIKHGNLRGGIKFVQGAERLLPSAGVTGEQVARKAGLTAAELAGPAAGRMHAMVPSMAPRQSFSAADLMARVRQQGEEEALRRVGLQGPWGGA